MNKNSDSNSTEWTIKESSSLYGLNKWGENYFSINDLGHITVKPKEDKGEELDLIDLIKELEGRNLKLPLLIRFDDILENRMQKLHEAFLQAIKNYKYKNIYQGVFPIKCNQQRHVIEKLISCGRKWHFGLEAGSKAELLIALSLVEDSEALLICNGYKDKRYIETAILARQIGRQTVIVIEQADEIERIITASNNLGAAPIIGIRAKLSSQSSGRWKSSAGDKSKFGLSIPEILSTINKLRSAKLLHELKFLHFHIGSQINDIALLKDALQEAGQIYVELKKLGAPMGYLDVGGGLGIDYDGSKTATTASTNYSLQNYANDVVATIQECCESKSIEEPILISESGRAIASHFSILVFNVLGENVIHSEEPVRLKNENTTVKNLRATLALINKMEENSEIDTTKLQEAWNDALKFKEDALTAFRLGYLDLTERAMAENLTWCCVEKLINKISKGKNIPEELKGIKNNLSKTYYANLSIFRSLPDTWAIEQLFPVMPIHRLNEKPTNLGHFADLTCDSDGKLTKFINNGTTKPLLELHSLKKNENYFIGIFLSGAYQEVMGNMHNLFGSTNTAHIQLSPKGGYKVDRVVKANTKADVLKAMEHKPDVLLEKLRLTTEHAINKGLLKISDAQRLMEHIETSLRQSTYLQD